MRVHQGPDEDLWLRINAGGHTAAVEAICFTPDSTRLCSAGLDKSSRCGTLGPSPATSAAASFVSGPFAGRLPAACAAASTPLSLRPTTGLLAFGGYGAMGSLGEILLVNPLDGSLSKVLEGHRQTVCSLAFSADGQWLASQDTGGAAILWKRGQWQPTVLYEPDEKTYGPEKAALIARQPKLRPIVFAGKSHVVLPVFVGEERPDGSVGNSCGRRRQQQGFPHARHRPLRHGQRAGRSADGALLASADLEGNLYLWDLAAGRAERLEYAVARDLSVLQSPTAAPWLRAPWSLPQRPKANCRFGTFGHAGSCSSASCQTTSAPAQSVPTASVWPTRAVRTTRSLWRRVLILARPSHWRARAGES